MKFPKILDTDAEIAQKYNGHLEPRATVGEVRAMLAGLALLTVAGGAAAVYNEVKEDQHCAVILDSPTATANQINECY